MPNLTAQLQKESSSDLHQKLENLFEDTLKKVGKVGFLENQKYPTGISVAQVAFQLEFGNASTGLRSWPFFRQTISKYKNKWRALAEKLAAQVVSGEMTFEIALEQLGLVAAGDVRRTISEIEEPKLKESTIKARIAKRKSGKRTGSIEKPLIDSAILLNEVTNKVENL